MASVINEINRLIIGVGGTGSRIVDHLLGNLLMVEEASRRLRVMRFIVIDSDRQSLSSLKNINREETSEYATKIIIDIPPRETLRDVNPWMPDFLLPTSGQGAGNRRAFGKALYWYARESILSAILRFAERMRNETRSNNFLVILVVGLGGGTGSGMFLDLAIDLSTQFQKEFGVKPFIIGIGVLPSPVEYRVNRANAYGALKELHFIMNMGKDIGLKRKYENPFNSFILISRSIRGSNKDTEITEAISRFLMDLGFIPYKYRELAGGEKKDLSDLMTRIQNYKNMFSTIGYYMVYIPARLLVWMYLAEEELPRLKKSLEELNKMYMKINSLFRKLETNIDTAQKEISTFIEKLENWKTSEYGSINVVSKVIDKVIRELQAINNELVRKDRDRINKIFTRLKNIEENIGKIKDRIKEIEEISKSIRNMIKAGKFETTIYQIPLFDEQIELLRKEYKWLDKEATLKDLMVKLNMYDGFIDTTVRRLSSGSIAWEPLLNYESLRANDLIRRLEEKYSRILLEKMTNYGLLEQTESGTLASPRWKLGYILSMVVTNMNNVDKTSESQIQSFKIFAEKYISSHAETLVVFNEIRRFSFVVYWWMSGLKLYSPLPNDKPRLRDIEHLEEAYEYIKSEQRHRGIITHHALFLGQPADLAQLIGEVLETPTPIEGREFVVNFWSNYEIIDPETVVDSISIALLLGLIDLENMSQIFKDLKNNVIDRFEDLVKAYDELDRDPVKLLSNNFNRKRIVLIRNELLKMHQNLKKIYSDLNGVNDWINRMIPILSKMSQIRRDQKGIVRAIIHDIEPYNVELPELIDNYLPSLVKIEDFAHHIIDYVEQLPQVSIRLGLKKNLDNILETIKSIREYIDRIREQNDALSMAIQNLNDIIKLLTEVD